MMPSPRQRADHVVWFVERHLGARASDGTLPADAVLAMDIVTHALEFTPAEHRLHSWRAALWERVLDAPSRAAVVRMIEQLVDDQARGRAGAAADICNCLNAVLGPSVGGLHRAQL